MSVPDFKFSKSNIYIVEAIRLGYRVVEDKVISPSNRELSFIYDKDGYPMIHVYFKKKSMLVYVHRLAAFQYYGMDLFIKGNCVLHLDNDVSNFSKDNLKVGSQSENEKQKYTSGNGRKRSIKINPVTLIQIIEMLETHTQTEISKKLGISRKRVNHIANSHLPKRFKPNENYKVNLESILS